MSLMPAFELGLWNTWILTLYFPLHPLLMMLIDQLVGTGDIIKNMGNVPYNKTQNRTFTLSMLILIPVLIYTVFLPLKLGTAWLYAGLIIYLLGFIMLIIAIVNIARTPPGEPFTKGLYRYSRHPMILAMFLTFIGAGIASASWVFLLFSTISTIMWFVLVSTEEQGCLETYGEAYREYMNRTPRWIGLPK